MHVKVVIVLILQAMLLVPVCWATTLERSLPVSVSIDVSQDSPDLEIVADKDFFLTAYDYTSQRFMPLNITFKVRSVSGQNVTYDLSITQLDGACDGATLSGMTTALDGTLVGLNEKRRSAGIENSHLLMISFPNIPQSTVEQLCEGSVGVIAELGV